MAKEPPLLAMDPFRPYVEAMEKLGFNRDIQTIWLTRIYPFDKFLVNGKPLKIRKLSRKNRPVVNNQSLAQFKAALGIATKRNESGIRQTDHTRIKRKKKLNRRKDQSGQRSEYMIGDPRCRTAFFALERGYAKGELVQQLKEHHNQQKKKGKNLYQRVCNTQGYAARLLFRELMADERIQKVPSQ